MKPNEMNKKNVNEAPAAAIPVQNSASQPHGTTQDQVNEMESEGQATKPGQDPAAAGTQLPDKEFRKAPQSRDGYSTRDACVHRTSRASV
jgi:hypothetical protein